jgi:murein DD-endopeptidase MepM/ murein hydrolase activator NlpD
LAKKPYTILIVSQKTAKVKKFIFSSLAFKIGGIFLAVLITISAFILYDYVIYKEKVVELRKLRAETQSQREEIKGFVAKMGVLEEQLQKLRELERQMEEDLREVQDLKKKKKVSPVVSRKGPLPSINSVLRKKPVSPEDQVSILERERPKLVSRLHQDLLELHQEAFLREQNFKELQGFLREQKSILQATPSLWPVWGRVTSKFGDTRLSESSGGFRPHQGLDIAAPPKTPILAPADGFITFAANEAEYGRMICIDHGHGFTTIYGHLHDIAVRPGEKIFKGQKIGTVGMSGKTTGPHLHYEIRVFGTPVNPLPYLTQTS